MCDKQAEHCSVTELENIVAESRAVPPFAFQKRVAEWYVQATSQRHNNGDGVEHMRRRRREGEARRVKGRRERGGGEWKTEKVNRSVGVRGRLDSMYDVIKEERWDEIGFRFGAAKMMMMFL